MTKMAVYFIYYLAFFNAKKCKKKIWHFYFYINFIFVVSMFLSFLLNINYKAIIIYIMLLIYLYTVLSYITII